MVNAHGLAAAIRSAQDSETFDLGGQNVATITATMESAFAEPFELNEMIRLTFVTGAGKQNRQKYDEGAAKAVSSVLSKHDYQEDRGASCVMECAGSYKLQHDTGKNLKTVVVFPKTVSEARDSSSKEQAEDSLIPEDSPGFKIAVSSMVVFKNMIKSKCQSCSQKKGCLGSIEALKELVQDLDSQLIKGTPLTDSEQSFYDSVVNLDEKEEYVRQQAQIQVETGNITQFEKELLLSQNAERIATLRKEGKSTAKAVARKELLESIEPIQPRPLKNHAQIGKLQKELVPVLQLEAETKGRLLTIKETRQMSRKDEILDEIEYLEHTSRGWFEDDGVFESRVQASRNELARHRKGKRGGGGATVDATTKVRVPVNKWVTPGEARGGFSSAARKRKTKMNKVDVFGAMMMDSSDEEEDEEEDDAGDFGAVEPRNTTSNAAAPVATATPKKKLKKKKKKPKSKPKESASQEQRATEVTEEQKEETAVAQAGAFLQAYVLPVLVAFLGWLVSLVFGKPKKKRG